jgi:predicted nucleic acid-binding protein
MASRTDLPLPTLVVDTSVALKWIFIQEDDANKAIEIRRAHEAGQIKLLVPATFFYEVANVLIRGQYRLNQVMIEAYYRDLRSLTVSIAQVGQRLIRHAMHLAYAYGPSVYDALFLALAQREQCDFVTADRRAWTRLHDLTHIHLLSDYQVP